MISAGAVRKAGRTILRNGPLQIALFFLPLVWIGYFAITSSERTDAIQQARSHGNSVAELFEENTERIFERVDQSLLVVRALYAQDPLTFSLKFWSDKARIATGDVVQFALIGLDGYMLDTTTGYSGPPLYLGDREHFINVMAQTDDRLYVAKPVLGRASHKWTIQLARKLFDLARNPVGVVVGSISVDVVGRFYDTAKLGAGGTLVLRNANHVVLAARGVDQGSVLGQRAEPRRGRAGGRLLRAILEREPTEPQRPADHRAQVARVSAHLHRRHFGAGDLFPRRLQAEGLSRRRAAAYVHHSGRDDISLAAAAGAGSRPP